MSMLQRINITLLLITIVSGCASLPEEIAHATEPLITQPSSTLSQLIVSNRPEQVEAEMSAVLVLNTGWHALAQRLALIETAEHSIDIQYYIWNTDVSGRYLASRILAAANRGVQVRVMLDDINLNQRERLLATLDRHPKIDIRIFNPIPSRHGVIKWFNFLGDFSRLNRRMHNKSFTVDGALAVIGGRNIGDEYFDLADDINFRDRDVLVAGSAVTDIQTSFLAYWNSRWSYPVNLLADKSVIDLAMLDKVSTPHYSHYPALPTAKDTAKLFLTQAMSKWSWLQARFVFDRPVPIDSSDTSKPKATARVLAKLAQQTKQEIILESAYLIFDDRQLAELQQLTSQGIQIKTLTNSMASNDLATNHSGYAARRQEMLEHGLQLFELKPQTKLCEISTRDVSKCAPTAAYGLHAKSAVFDQNIAVIGSFNFNLRSTYLNTESLLIIENQAIAESLAHDIAQAMHEDNSWRVSLDEGKLRWYSGEQSWDSEPDTGQWQRIKSRFLQLLPIEKYL